MQQESPESAASLSRSARQMRSMHASATQQEKQRWLDVQLPQHAFPRDLLNAVPARKIVFFSLPFWLVHGHGQGVCGSVFVWMRASDEIFHVFPDKLGGAN